MGEMIMNKNEISSLRAGNIVSIGAYRKIANKSEVKENTWLFLRAVNDLIDNDTIIADDIGADCFQLVCLSDRFTVTPSKLMIDVLNALAVKYFGQQLEFNNNNDIFWVSR